jgi:hypothetical protein
VSSTLGGMTSNNQAHRNQNEDLERRLNQEINLKLRQGQDISRLKEMLQSRDMEVKDQSLRASQMANDLERYRATIQMHEEEEENVNTSNLTIQSEFIET